MPEADLYPPVKQFLESQGYEVKGEVDACDVVGVRGDEPPVIVELKERLSLALLLQAVDRLAMTEAVYVAFRTGRGRSAAWRSHGTQVVRLLRRAGLGLLTVSARDIVTPELDPGPYRPRTNGARRRLLLEEFRARAGDTETGGSPSRPRLTANRQDALRCARELSEAGVLRPRDVRERAGVERAAPILRDNHYGWFTRVERGRYELSRAGRGALREWAQALSALAHPGPATGGADAAATLTRRG